MARWKENWENLRTWIDSDRNTDLTSQITYTQENKSESEMFLQKLLVAVEESLKKEITRISFANKAYIPDEFRVFISEEADKDLRGEKRLFFEQGISAIILDKAREMAGDLELTSQQVNVKITLNGLLKENELEVRAITPGTQNTFEVVDQEFKPETFRTNGNNHTVDDIGTIDDAGTELGILYRVEIWQSGKKLNEIPVILRTNTIGRDDMDKTANLRLPTENRKISRIHAEVSMGENGDIWVTSLHKNPTTVSGKVISNGEKAKLGDDGEIQIYDFLLKLKFA